MVVSSFCSHQCSGHSICLAKCLAWVWKRFCLSATLVISKEYWDWSRAPCSQNQMFDYPPGVRNYPPIGCKARDWLHGSLPRVKCCRKLVQWRCVHMCISTWSYLLGWPGKIHSPCKCRSVAICDSMRGAFYTFNNFDSSVINQYTSSFTIQYSVQRANRLRNVVKLERSTSKNKKQSIWTLKGTVRPLWKYTLE